MAHPLRAWRDRNGHDLERVADMLATSGERPSPAYLRHIENGINQPGWALAKRIAALTGGDPVEIKDWQKPATDTPDAA